jgi:hypothetical protein
MYQSLCGNLVAMNAGGKPDIQAQQEYSNIVSDTTGPVRYLLRSHNKLSMIRLHCKTVTGEITSEYRPCLGWGPPFGSGVPPCFASLDRTADYPDEYH